MADVRIKVTLPMEDLEYVELVALTEGESVAHLCRRVLLRWARRHREQKKAVGKVGQNGPKWAKPDR